MVKLQMINKHGHIQGPVGAAKAPILISIHEFAYFNALKTQAKEDPLWQHDQT